jgi:hypothetical protein
MAVERKHRISMCSAVMSFQREGLAFHLLRTPGRQDFSEDTYRTLTARRSRSALGLRPPSVLIDRSTLVPDRDHLLELGAKPVANPDPTF